MSKFNRVVLFSLFSFFICFTASGQEFLRIKGRVVEATTSRIIPFVTVQIKDVPLGSITEEDGKFAVKIPLEYAKDTLVFSSVGYEKLFYPIAQLKEGEENLISLEVAVMQLAEVTVTRGKKKKPLKLLKEAIAKIPENYPIYTFTYDAFYRERIIENGATIKYSDAATTFQQGGYTGMPRRRRRSALQGFGYYGNGPGIRLGSYSGFFGIKPAGERLHDHFGLRSESSDMVKVHDSRASLNMSREKMNANVEGGPLSTMSKDLVRNLDLFTHKKRFKRYRYELFESPDDEGNWYYVVRFKPKKKPAKLEWIREKRGKNKATSRLNILSGSIWIEQETMAIAKINYSVQNDYRRHICNLQENQIKHYGYEVETNYQKVEDRWQLKDMKRIDEFIYKDTVNEQTTPYSTITELIVTNPKSELERVPPTENFLNIITNSLYSYPLEYNKEFWDEYEAKVPQAILSDELRIDMQAVNTLEEQFAMKHTRNDSLQAPVAPIVAATQRVHGQVLMDNYQWLKDTKSARNNPEVMEYLIKENEYADNYFIPLRSTERDLVSKLYKMTDRESKSDPVKSYGYWYWSKYEGDNDYRTIYRRKDGEGEKAEVLWDLQTMAEDTDYFSLNFYSISPDNQYMAYAIDTSGNQMAPVHIKNMSTNEVLSDSLRDVGAFVWSEDNKGFFYSVVNSRTRQHGEIKYHVLGTLVSSDSSYFQESDAGINLSISKSRSKEFLYMYSSGNNSNELYLARNKAPFVFEKVRDKEPDVSYSFNHIKDQFYIMTDQAAPNGRLLKTDTANWTFDQWKEVIPASDSVILANYEVFDNHLVTLRKERMKERIEIRDLNSTNVRTIINESKLGDVYSLWFGRNRDPSADSLRYYASSPSSKTEKVAYHLGTGKSKRKLAIRSSSLGPSYFTNFIKTRLVWANARDGAKIPVSLLFSAQRTKHLGNRPVFVEAYGAYGASSNMMFDPSAQLLLEQGFIYAYVHVRGGGDLGEHWYQQGKMENKMNSFTDLIDAVEYLTANGYGHQKKVFASGGSAGGLLMGAVVNMRPDLFQGVLLDVPFVDVINTMMDESLPLTKGEYTEWGNPKKKKEFKQMLAYSPYDNVKEQAYPRMAYYAGLNDRNVGYWEAAKMVARLRANKTDDNILLLRTGFHAGHGPSSGRFAALAFTASKYAILFEWLNEVNAEIILARRVKKP